ncbi:MAG: type II toxin-antitoxin system prevent-host-death family antitoxin [Bacteroidetes bacterium]|jgi:prevent-host-death family protein|nr:type II toxin-antitoxin system prevent-host-death family antitoxin [Bacteroidota bacterium]
MEKVNIHNAKTHLSKLIEKVLDGEEIIIAKYGKPLVRLEPYRPVEKRTPGSWKGKVWIAEDFDELPEEIEKPFKGELD